MRNDREEMKDRIRGLFIKEFFWHTIWILCLVMSLVFEISRRDAWIHKLESRATAIEQKLEELK